MTTYYWRPDDADAGGSPSDLELSEPWVSFRDIRIGYHDPDYDNADFNPGVGEIARTNRPALVFDHGTTSDNNARRAAVIDAIDGESIGDATDAEIWMRFLPVGESGDSKAIFRQSGTGGVYRGYIGGVHRDHGRVDIGKYYNGNGEYIASDGDVSGSYEYWQQRIRVDGDQIYVKAWRDTEDEPTDWTLVTTDGDVDSPGRLGYFQYHTSWNDDHAAAGAYHYTYVYEMGVATDGERAPTGPLNRHEILSDTRANGVATSPADEWLAVARNDGHIDIYEIGDYSLIETIPEGDRHAAAAASYEETIKFSPNADYLAVSLTSPQATRVFDTDGWSEVASFDGGYGLDWNTDGSLLGVVDSDGVSLYNTDDWTEHASRSDSAATSVGFANTTSDELAYVADNGHLEYCDTSFNTIEIAPIDGGAASVTFSGDDQLVAVGTWNNSVHVYNPHVDGMLEEYYDSEDDDETLQFQGSVYSVEFADSHDWLAYGNGAGGNGMIRVVDTTDWSYVDEYYASDDVESIEFYGNGLRVAVGDRSRVELLEISGDGYRGIELPEGAAEHFAVKKEEWDTERNVEAIYVNHDDGEGEQLAWRRE